MEFTKVLPKLLGIALQRAVTLDLWNWPANKGLMRGRMRRNGAARADCTLQDLSRPISMYNDYNLLDALMLNKFRPMFSLSPETTPVLPIGS